jgi:glycosyltransferase involved in cell wall biosynthesis
MRTPYIPRVVIDCRWLNSGGAGRVTELLLRGLRKSELKVKWVLWGPGDTLQNVVWPGSEIADIANDPRERNGQRNWFQIPPAELTLFMHQQRPLRAVPSVTLIHDTIPLRYATGPVQRGLKRAFLRRVAAISRELLTDSDYSRECIARDLGVARETVTVIRWPADAEMAERILKLRRQTEPQKNAIYLGLFLPHKNLDRLLAAFAETRFCAEGGKLTLMGGLGQETDRLISHLNEDQKGWVSVHPFSSQEDLEYLLATSRFLVQPSLEEGFGLPAWEALCCGLPVCASDGGSLPEITRGQADIFPAASTEQMVTALDRCAARAELMTQETAERASQDFISGSPSIFDLARQVEGIVERNLGPRHGLTEPAARSEN